MISPSPDPKRGSIHGEAPIAAQARKDVSALVHENKDYLPGLNSDKRKRTWRASAMPDISAKWSECTAT